MAEVDISCFIVKLSLFPTYASLANDWKIFAASYPPIKTRVQKFEEKNSTMESPRTRQSNSDESHFHPNGQVGRI